MNVSLNKLQTVVCFCWDKSKHWCSQLCYKITEVALQWSICMFHCNEFPLRHFTMHLYDKFLGLIGCSMIILVKLFRIAKSCQLLPLMLWPARKRLNGVDVTEKNNLYYFCVAIKIGLMTQQLTNSNPGHLVCSKQQIEYCIFMQWLHYYSPLCTFACNWRHIENHKLWFSAKHEPQYYKEACCKEYLVTKQISIIRSFSNLMTKYEHCFIKLYTVSSSLHYGTSRRDKIFLATF